MKADLRNTGGRTRQPLEAGNERSDLTNRDQRQRVYELTFPLRPNRRCDAHVQPLILHSMMDSEHAPSGQLASLRKGNVFAITRANTFPRRKSARPWFPRSQKVLLVRCLYSGD